MDDVSNSVQGGMSPEERPRVAPPPPPDVSIRTMNSDIRSLEQGQTKPLPETVPGPTFGAPQSGEPIFKPETINQMSGGAAPKSKRALWIVVGLIVALGLGALGYFVVYPLLFPATPVVSPTPSPSLSPTATPTGEPQTRQSFFITPPAELTMLKLGSLEYDNVLRALTEVAQTGIAAGALQEVIIADASENPIPLGGFLPVFGAFSEGQLTEWFEADLTAFIFYDDKGSWPGYIAKLKPVAPREEAQTAITQLETVPLGKFYLEDPGTFGAFKDGQVNSKPARYTAGSSAGAAFSYTWLDDYLLISTSYNGAKEAATRLGF